MQLIIAQVNVKRSVKNWYTVAIKRREFSTFRCVRFRNLFAARKIIPFTRIYFIKMFSFRKLNRKLSDLFNCTGSISIPLPFSHPFNYIFLYLPRYEQGLEDYDEAVSRVEKMKEEQRAKANLGRMETVVSLLDTVHDVWTKVGAERNSTNDGRRAPLGFVLASLDCFANQRFSRFRRDWLGCD